MTLRGFGCSWHIIVFLAFTESNTKRLFWQARGNCHVLKRTMKRPITDCQRLTLFAATDEILPLLSLWHSITVSQYFCSNRWKLPSTSIWHNALQCNSIEVFCKYYSRCYLRVHLMTQLVMSHRAGNGWNWTLLGLETVHSTQIFISRDVQGDTSLDHFSWVQISLRRSEGQFCLDLSCARKWIRGSWWQSPSMHLSLNTVGWRIKFEFFLFGCFAFCSNFEWIIWW